MRTTRASGRWSPGPLALLDRVVPDSDRAVVARAVRHLFTPLLERLTFDPRPDDGERTPALRASVIRTLGVIGEDAAVRDEATARFARSPATPLDPDTESAILEVVANRGGAEEYETILARYRKPANPQEENRYLYALASFTDPGLAARTFDLAMSEVRTQNAPFVIQMLLANRVVGPRHGPGSVTLGTRSSPGSRRTSSPGCSTGSAACAHHRAWPTRSPSFLEAHPLAAGGRTVEQTLERLAVNVAFGQREGRRLAATDHRGALAPGGRRVNRPDRAGRPEPSRPGRAPRAPLDGAGTTMPP